MPFFSLKELKKFATAREEASNYHQGSKGGLARILATHLEVHEAKLLPGVEYPTPQNSSVDITAEFSLFKSLLYVAYLENLRIEIDNYNTGIVNKIACYFSSIDYFVGMYKFDIEERAKEVDKLSTAEIPPIIKTEDMKALSQGLHGYIYGFFKQITQYENAQNLAIYDRVKDLTPIPEAAIKEIIVEGYLGMAPRR